MESARTIFCASPPFPPRTHHWNTLPSSSYTSVLMFREQAAPTVSSRSTSVSAQKFPTSVLLQEQRDEQRPLLHVSKEDKTCQAVLNARQVDMSLVHEENNIGKVDQVVDDFWQHLHLWPHLQNLLTSSETGEVDASSTLQHVTVAERPANGVPCNAISLGRQALSPSKHEASVADDLKSISADDDADDSIPFSFADPSRRSNKTVRSTRLLERQSKQRKVSKSKVKDNDTYLARKDDPQERIRVKRKINEAFDQNDPQRLFLRSPGKKLLPIEEESQLIVQIQDLLKLEELKTSLQSQFGREPTMAEWAEGAGLKCRALQMKLRCGNRSREKLIKANLRMVLHVAKTYQGRGLSLQDLLQEGSMGLLKSVKKFKPQVGCRFGSYAYWWIKQAIRKAIFHHSRTIRLPEKVYTQLGKILEAKKLYIQEGNLRPTKEDLARRVGISEDKISSLLYVARIPMSMQQTVWTDQNTTFQEITADTSIESPDTSVSKELMRRHVLNLLSTLRPKERRIIRLRFGFEDGEQKSLSEVGEIFGLSKERVRQLENRAFYKLKKCLASQGLDAYADLLV